MWTTNQSPAILNILPQFHFSLWHIAVHTLSLFALWYWCNMLIQLLFFKYDVCHKEFKLKSAAASWNAILLCLLSSHFQHHFRNFWRRRSLLREDPCIHYWNYFLTSKGHVTWIISKVNSIPKHSSMALSQRLRLRWIVVEGMLRCYQKRWKNALLLQILKFPHTRMWQQRNP